MTTFRFNELSEAPEQSQPTLAAAQQKYGFLPNLMKGLSESPAALNSSVSIMGYLSDSTLTPAEQHLVFIAISTENECDYCVAAHTGAALVHERP